MPKYHSIDTIPAKVFFEVLKTKNYQLLKPKPSEKDLEAVFMAIYDEYFIKSDNHQANEFLRLTNEIAFLNYKITVIRSTLQFVWFNQVTPEMKSQILKALREGCDIDIDETLNFADEVKRVLTIEVGILENDLKILEIDFKGLIKESQGKDFDYYDSIIGLSNVHGRSLNSDLILAEYIAYEKSAEKIIDQQKKRK
jgi:hypothetical protein